MSTIVWDEVLENVFTATVSGIDCVLETENQVYTYRVTNGVANLKGEGDLHDVNYDRFQRSIKLSGNEYYSDSSALYTLSLYPTDTLYEVYSTINPIVATTGAVCIIFFTSILFILYDFCVRREFSTKNDLLDSKRRFVRFVSHEVRTPLNSVCMGLTLMQDEIAISLGYKSSDDFLECTESNNQLEKLSELKQKESVWLNLVQDIQSNAQSSIDVLNDLLNYDKVETGTLRLELTIISMWKLIEKTTNEFLLPATKKKIDFELIFTDLEQKDPKPSALRAEVRNCKIVGDAVRLTQVLRNLVSNALKFTPEGGKLVVQASWVEGSSNKKDKAKEKLFLLKNGEEVLVKPSGHLQVQVQDTGAGMSTSQLAQLFRHGVQFNVNDLQAGQGSGLGLFIAKGIVEQHEGRLWADSEGIGRGTTFTVSLPMYHVPGLEERSCPDESGQTGDITSRSESACLRILVVDDASTNRKLLSRLMTNRGHHSDMAEDGEVALAMVKEAILDENPYDTILLDYEMPVMNGPTTAKELRAMGCDVFIVGVTGNMLAEDVTYFQSCGADAVLGKPINIASLDEIWSEYGITGQSPSDESKV
jgi:signal transduction histidine kinase/ActR/RegA family two-component response regulator